MSPLQKQNNNKVAGMKEAGSSPQLLIIISKSHGKTNKDDTKLDLLSPSLYLTFLCTILRNITCFAIFAKGLLLWPKVRNRVQKLAIFFAFWTFGFL